MTQIDGGKLPEGVRKYAEELKIPPAGNAVKNGVQGGGKPMVENLERNGMSAGLTRFTGELVIPGRS